MEPKSYSSSNNHQQRFLGWGRDNEYSKYKNEPAAIKTNNDEQPKVPVPNDEVSWQIQPEEKKAITVQSIIDEEDWAKIMSAADGKVNNSIGRYRENKTENEKKEDAAVITRILQGIDAANPKNKNIINNALRIAAESNNLEVVQVLLNKGANPNDVDRNGYTAFTLAAKNGNATVFNLMFKKIEHPQNMKDQVLKLNDGAAANATLLTVAFKAQIDALIKELEPYAKKNIAGTVKSIFSKYFGSGAYKEKRDADISADKIIAGLRDLKLVVEATLMSDSGGVKNNPAYSIKSKADDLIKMVETSKLSKSPSWVNHLQKKVKNSTIAVEKEAKVIELESQKRSTL